MCIILRPSFVMRLRKKKKGFSKMAYQQYLISFNNSVTPFSKIATFWNFIPPLEKFNDMVSLYKYSNKYNTLNFKRIIHQW